MLESYITPLLMSYVNKYIKNLKPSDLSLSVWGGDVVLQNLDLNLDVLQKELNLPVKFLSGRIHELRIHVPWTRITYEPVTITINTIEFIIKLRDADEKVTTDEQNEKNAKELKKELQKAKQQRESEHLSPGYVQGMLNKVVNNISVNINNIILKYVEDDIVLSLNIKSVSLYSANERWERDFVELTLPSLCLRKICDISNLTICLDSRNADGKIEMYQDPLLYKCNLSCRILSKYQGIGSLSAYENQINLYCETLEMSITDVQLPMLIRLLDLCLGLYYRTLDLPGCHDKPHAARAILEERSSREIAKKEKDNYDENDDNLNDSSWASWVWSKVPYISDDPLVQDNNYHDHNSETVLSFEFFISNYSLTLKVTEEANSGNSLVVSRRFQFSPFLCIEMSGCAVKLLAKGEEYFDCQLGISSISCYLIGNCLCKKAPCNITADQSDTSLDESECHEEDELFCQFGCPRDSYEDGVVFLQNSLFCQTTMDVDSLHLPTMLPEKGNQYIEADVMKNFSAFFMDYFYTMTLPKNISKDGSTQDGSEEAVKSDTGFVIEVSTKRLIVGHVKMCVTSPLFHMVKKLKEFSSDNSPARKVKDYVYLDPFVIEQLKAGNHGVRGFHITFHSASITLSFADHLFGQASDAASAFSTMNGYSGPHGISVQIDRIDYQLSSPMYPKELNSLIEGNARSKALLYRAAFCDHYLKAFGIQIGLSECIYHASESTVLNLLPPTHASVYFKNCICENRMQERPKIEMRAETPSLTMSITKPQLMMIIDLMNSWKSKSSATIINENLVNDVFHPKGRDGVSSVLDLSLIGLQLKYYQNDSIHALSGSLGSIKVAIQALRNEKVLQASILYGPLNTQTMNDVDIFLSTKDEDLLELPNGCVLDFKFHLPNTVTQSNKAPSVVLIEVKGIALNIDPLLLKWIDYSPSPMPSQRKQFFQRRSRRPLSRTLSASTPKKRSYSRVFGTTKLSRERNKATRMIEGKEQDLNEGNAPENSLEYAITILKSLIIKVDLETFAIIMPRETTLEDQLSMNVEYNIPYHLRSRFNANPATFPGTVVIALPQLCLESTNTKDLEPSSNIPLKINQTVIKENSLPWSLRGYGFSVYTLDVDLASTIPNNEGCHIWKPSAWSMSLAAGHIDSKASSQISFASLRDSLTKIGGKSVIERHGGVNDDGLCLELCIHIDLASILISISRRQVIMVLDVLSKLMKTLNHVKREETIQGHVTKASIQGESKSVTKMNSEKDDDNQSLSTTSTIDPQDDVTLSTGASIQSARSFSLQKQNDDVAISLWLQWIIPKMSITFYSDPEIGDALKIYRIPIELEDISVAIDCQGGVVQMTNKIASLAISNQILRNGSKVWEADKFGGVLLSGNDILARNIDMLSSSRISSSSFFTITYSRIPFQDVHTRSRHESIRSEAAVCAEDIENNETSVNDEMREKICVNESGVYQQRMTISLQPVDVLLVIEPIVSVADSILSVDLMSNFQLDSKTLSEVKQVEPVSVSCEGTFSPLPLISLESKDIRIILPAETSYLDAESDAIAIYCIQSLVISSDPENRIRSKILNKDWIRYLRKYQRERGRRTKTWHVQYQIDLEGMSLWSGTLRNLQRDDIVSNAELELSKEKQNPALEWNYEQLRQKEPSKLTPMLKDFSCRTVISPCLSISLKEQRHPLRVCAASIEMNFQKDVKAFANPEQIDLVLDIMQNMSKCFEPTRSSTLKSGAEASNPADSPFNIDSGVCSTISAKVTETPKMQQCLEVTETSPFDVLITANKISLSLYMKVVAEGDGKSTQPSGCQPIMYFHVVQPSVNMSYCAILKSLDFVLYDFLLSLPKYDTISDTVVPDHSLYHDTVIQTGRGQQNTKSGLFPSALSINVTGNKYFHATVDVGRSIDIKINVDSLHKLALFWKALNLQAQLDTIDQTTSSDIKSQQTYRNEEFLITDADCKTNRICITISKAKESTERKLIARLRCLDGKMHFKNDKYIEMIKTMNMKCSVDGLEVVLAEEENQYVLLSSCIFEVDGHANMISHGRSLDSTRVSQKLRLMFKSGFLRLRFGQQHMQLLTAFIDSLSSNNENIVLENNKVKCPGDGSDVKEDTNKQEQCEYSYDDLRTSTFEYVIHCDEERAHPNANEILFSNDDDEEKPPWMAWRYPLPRFLTAITIMPLPFHLDESLPHEEDVTKIPCAIRYWDDVEQIYVTYGNFFLSQTDSCTLLFPDPSSKDLQGDVIAAQEWQVVVDVAIESENGEGEIDDIPEDILQRIQSVYKTPVSSTSLAACMKVDSCFVPEKIPYLIGSVSIGCLQITLLNHFDITEHEQSKVFSPFYLDPFTYPSEQEAFLLNLQEFSSKFSLTDGDIQRHNVTIESDLNLDILNYNDLSWFKLAEIKKILTEMTLNYCKTKANENELDIENSNVSLYAANSDIFVSQSTVHTAVLTCDYWQNYQTQTDVPILNHYIVCNETEEVLRFGQIGTDEDILLASGQMHPYSWRSPCDRAFHICIDSIGDWKWTSPFIIDDTSGCTRTIKHNTHSSVLHIEIRRIGGIQKQIIIRGGLVFRNALSKDLEFEVILHHAESIGPLQQQKITQVVKRFVVPAQTARPSMIISPENVTAMYVRFCGHEGLQGWTSALSINIEMNQSVCISLKPVNETEARSCWFKVSNVCKIWYTQLQVCLCPLYIVRSHLGWPVMMTALSRDKDHEYSCKSYGKGTETEIFELRSSTWYNITFQLEGTSECTDPPLSVNTTFVELLEKKKRIDTKDFVYQSEWPYNDDCSIPAEKPPKIISHADSSSSLLQPSADLQCQLLQRWPNLPTIVIEIRPKFIVCNKSSIDLILRDTETRLTWDLMAGAAVTSPAIQTGVQFSFQKTEQVESLWSLEIQLLEHIIKPEPRNVNMEMLNLHSYVTFSIIDAANFACYQFALSSKKRNGIIIVTVSDRFCVRNSTGVRLHCFPTLSATQSTNFEENYADFLNSVDSAEALQINKVMLMQPMKSLERLNQNFDDLDLKFHFSINEELPKQSDSLNAFNLSREHLRENISLMHPGGGQLLIAVTSCFEDGIIHVFLENDYCPCYVFKNQTGLDLIVKSFLDEKSLQVNKDLSISSETLLDVFALGSGCTISCQTEAFKTRFPRIEDPSSGLFQLVVCPETDETSNIIKMKNNIIDQEVKIGDRMLHLSCQNSSNCFYVFISETSHRISSVRHHLNLPTVSCRINKSSFVLIDHSSFEEVIALHTQDLSISHEIYPIDSGFIDDSESSLSFEIGSLQIDNQLTVDSGHFPVILLPLREVSQRYHGEVSQNAPLADIQASKSCSFVRVNTKLYESGKLFVDSANVNIEPLEVYVEDIFIYRIVSFLDSLMPPRIINSSRGRNENTAILESTATQILLPLNVGNIDVGDIKILLSIHASVKMYLATDHMPVVLGKFNCCPAKTTSKELSRRLLYHYATQALVRAGLMLGSLEILANPTGLIRSIGQGVIDFFTFPYDGLIRGPSAFVSGITRGMGSFVRHTSVGALTSITNFASSLSRNLDRLSLDDQHILWQEEHRRKSLSQTWPGFGNALGGLGISLLGAIAGIVDHPMTNIQNADGTSDAVKGVMTGFGKGLVGIVTKPIGGAMELVSQTGQGILLGTGLAKSPAKIRLPLSQDDIMHMEIESFMKYSWKVIRFEFQRSSDLFIVSDVHVTSMADKQGYNGAIILTSSALYLFDVDVNNIRKAFSCNEIRLRQKKDGSHMIFLEKVEASPQLIYGISETDDASSHQECSYESNEATQLYFTAAGKGFSSCLPIFLQMSPRFATLLLSEFKYQRGLMEEDLANKLIEIAIYK